MILSHLNLVTKIAFYGINDCDNLETVIYCGTQEQWDAIENKGGNDSLTNATLQFHNLENSVCTICGYVKSIAGDIDGNKAVNHNDAIYLLLHTMFGEEMPRSKHYAG